MLTRDLVRYKTEGETITPEFIDPADPIILEIAGQLLEVFQSAQGQTRSELAEAAKPVIEGAQCPAIIVRGLEKLLLDRTEFDTAPDEELIEFRQKLFGQSNRILSEEPLENYEDYRERLRQEMQETPEEIAARLYSDLPDFHKVLKFKPLSAERLLHRYNAAQVQGLLIHCNSLELRVWDSPPALLRQLFKYLRFQQLLATIRKEGEENYRITVDGPLSLFYKTQKYGLSLALFFPAALHQENWELQAEIEFKNRRKYRLALDKSCGLQPYFHRFLAYVPEEILFFQETFQEKAGGWEIAPASNFIPLEGEFYCFPDYTLTHVSGAEISLELFHPWHAAHLTARLQHLGNLEKPPLIIGVSKVLLNDPLLAQSVENSPYFSRYGFVFREMPTAEKVLPVLERVLEKGRKGSW